MTRSTQRSRAAVSDDDDGYEENNVKKDVSDNESDNDEVSASSPSENDKNEDDYVEDDDDSDDDITTSRKRRRNGRNNRGAALDSDGDFEDNGSEVSDADTRKLIERNFVATDDEDEELSEDYEYGTARKKKKPSRSRSRSAELPSRRRPRLRGDGDNSNAEDGPGEDEDEDEEEDDIKKEIANLYDSSPDPEPIKHKLRERNKIDYSIPPPLMNDAQLESSAMPLTPSFSGKGRRGRPNTAAKSDYRNLLFPTAGPFGGSDVISLFGTNIPPGGIPIPGLTNTNNSLTAIGQNVSDSDSSDDEIAPINGDATVTKKPASSKNKVNNTTLIGTSASNDSKDRKKNTLSDSDPLGVDMNIDFSAVGGLDNYINQLKEMVALPLLYPELYQNFAITPPRGVLFHGPPGTGKTLMARALAASCSTSNRKITFFMRKGADCLSKWVGEAERQLRLLFEEAKNQQPSIIFFDEIDGLAPVRSSKQEQIHASIVSTLLALMDGMDNRGQVIVIGATNRPDSVDPALRRPGRFDREFYFPLPDANARAQILKIHTKKWQPPLSDVFVEKIADLTKGYGGADLRALCTEAALNSIQRKYPQIYQTNEKLQVAPSKVKVIAKDFMHAVEKIIPSSARSTTSSSAPLPQHLKCLLEPQFVEVADKLNGLLPGSIHFKGQKKKTSLDEALYLDPTINDSDGGFARQELLKNLESSRVCKPHLLICGDSGNGQQYIGSAILNYLEGFQVQSLDMGSIFEDSSRTPESAIIQAFIEARRHQPSVIFIPNIDIFFQVVPYSAKATLTSLLRSLKSNEKILLLGIAETNMEELDPEIKLIFGLNNDSNNVALQNPGVNERKEYFKMLERTLLMKPYEFVNDLDNRPKRKLKQLKVIEEEKVDDKELTKRKLKQQEYMDTKLKNTLKIKLASLMELFKVRYKRFKKPIIDENLLSHLFYPEILENPLNNYEILYERATDPEHRNMIKEIHTGKYYYNIDLDIVEERLWNGYYSEPKQFLKDIKMIVQDSKTSGDRERILKANEMLTNAQFGIDDISTPEFLEACKEMRRRELLKQAKMLEDHKLLQNKIKTGDLVLNQEQHQATPEIGTPADINIKPGIEMAPNGVSLQNGSSTVESLPTATTELNMQIDEISKTKEISDSEGEKNNSNNPETTEMPPDPESESEAEDVQIDTTKSLILPDNYKQLFDEKILDISNNCNIEKLEIVMAQMMDIIWHDRNIWDKTQTVQKLFAAADTIKESFN